MSITYTTHMHMTCMRAETQVCKTETGSGGRGKERRARESQSKVCAPGSLVGRFLAALFSAKASLAFKALAFFLDRVMARGVQLGVLRNKQ